MDDGVVVEALGGLEVVEEALEVVHALALRTGGICEDEPDRPRPVVSRSESRATS